MKHKKLADNIDYMFIALKRSVVATLMIPDILRGSAQKRPAITAHLETILLFGYSDAKGKARPNQ